MATDFAARAQAAGYGDAEILAAAVAIMLNVLVRRLGREGAADYLRQLADTTLAER